MISKEKLLKGYIMNDFGKLRDMFVKAAEHYGYEICHGNSVSWLDWEVIYLDGEGRVTTTNQFHLDRYKLTLEDFEEEKKQEENVEDFTIPWGEAPEGYDYWVVATGDLLSEGSFHKKNVLIYEDTKGFYWETGYEGLQYEVYTNPKLELLKQVQDSLESLKEVPEQDTPTKYKYTPVEVGSIFDIRNMFENGELYFEDANQGDDQGMVGIVDEGTLIVLLAGQDTIYTRKEVTWQDEVIKKARSLTVKDCCYSVYAAPLADILVESDIFLELARIALRATGELK